MKKKKIIELQKMALESSTSENILLQKYVEKLLSDKENLQAVIVSIEEKNKQEKETESEKDLKIKNLKSIIEDCKIELEERRKIIQQQKQTIENKDLHIDKLDKQLTKLVYQTVTDQKHIELLKHELKYYKDKEFKDNCIKL